MYAAQQQKRFSKRIKVDLTLTQLKSSKKLLQSLASPDFKDPIIPV